jgi:DNA-directed RNA polymerase subunit F
MNNDAHEGNAHRKARGLRLRLTGVILGSAVADGLLIAAGLHDLLPLPILLVLHFSLVPFIWLATRSCDPTLSAMAIISVAAMGPVGAVGTLLLAVALLPAREPSASSLAGWHGKLAKPFQVDLAERLSQAISEGRLIEPGKTAPVSFQEVSQQGSVAQRQTMLGIISQRFDPSFSTVIRQELTSKEAAVRVSAAAVFTKLRDKNRVLMGAGGPIPDVLTPNEAQERGIALARGVKSGLLDPADLEAARNRSLELLLLARPHATEADELEELISTLLIEEGRYEDVAERLAAIDPGSSSILRSVYAQLLMKAGRMTEAAEMMQRRHDNSVRLNLARRADDHALLSIRHGDRQ